MPKIDYMPVIIPKNRDTTKIGIEKFQEYLNLENDEAIYTAVKRSGANVVFKATELLKLLQIYHKEIEYRENSLDIPALELLEFIKGMQPRNK